MADRPILFSAPMVRALLAGRKTQTRRIASFIVPAGEQYHVRNAHGGWLGPASRVPEVAPDYAPYALGDRLWVKETWLTTPAYDDLKPSELGGEEPLFYVADGAILNWREADGHCRGKTRVSIFMPRWASRLTLTVTDIRVERLQDCSEADALAEGIERIQFPEVGDWGWPQRKYAALWDSINGAGAWEANPWVVAVSFDVREGNIDG